MLPQELFRHCPRCGVPLEAIGQSPLRCTCGFQYYFNPTVAAAAFIEREDGKFLFVQRARDPGKGLFTVPGGFVDIGETAEEALIREVQEEVGLTIRDVRYVCSLTNRYFYQEVTYPVCDLMFRAVAENPAAAIVGDGTARFEWRTLEEIDPNELAFPSVKHGLKLLAGTPTFRGR
jgi:ADP-ribose pyrophosphatase YjhB (NUDIX family)